MKKGGHSVTLFYLVMTGDREYDEEMKKIKSLVLAAVLAFTSTASFADDHSAMGTITGSEINMFAADHGFTGVIKNTLVFGNLDEETGLSELTFKKAGKIFHASFGKKSGIIGGIIESENADETTKSTEVKFVSIDKTVQTITVKIDNEEVKVAITADDFQNNHFINPTYNAVMKGQNVTFKLANGKACYNFSTHLIMMIMGAMAHL